MIMHSIATWYFSWGWFLVTILGFPVGVLVARTEKCGRNLLILTVAYFAFTILLVFFI